MIDWLVLRLPSDWIATRSDIDFEVTVKESTSEVGEWKVGHAANGWEVHVCRNGPTLLKGSIHKFHSGTHNGGAFGWHDVAAAVRCLSTWLQLPAEQVEIQVMEFGVNIPMPGKPAQLLQRALLHGTHQLNRNIYGGRGHMVEAVRTQYYLKLYDKGMQLATKKQLGYYPGHVLRIEVKTRAMEWVKSAGVATLADLSNPASLVRLGEILQRTFADMLFACPMPLPDGLTKKDAALLERGARVPYWMGLKPGSRTATKTRYRKVQALVPDELLQAATVGLPAAWLQLLNQPEPGAAAATVPALPLGLVRPFEPSFKGSDTGTHPHTPTTLLLPAAAGEGWQAGRQDGWQARPLSVVQSDDDEGTSERTEGSMQLRTPSTGGPVDGGPQHAPAPMEVSPAQLGQLYCHTCGLPINTGNPNAKFCSPKERGAQHAKRCRNADSNARLDTRRKVEAQRRRVGGTLLLPFTA